MYNANFYSPELHQAITSQQVSIDITIPPSPDDGKRPPNRTEFKIGDRQLSANVSRDGLLHYLLKPLLEHHHLPATVNGNPIDRLPFEPRAATNYRLMPSLLEGPYGERTQPFDGHRRAGVIIDGVKYLPDHTQWTYNVRSEHLPYPHLMLEQAGHMNRERERFSAHGQTPQAKSDPVDSSAYEPGNDDA